MCQINWHVRENEEAIGGDIWYFYRIEETTLNGDEIKIHSLLGWCWLRELHLSSSQERTEIIEFLNYSLSDGEDKEHIVFLIHCTTSTKSSGTEMPLSLWESGEIFLAVIGSCTHHFLASASLIYSHLGDGWILSAKS